jgi:hypothetical protein
MSVVAILTDYGIRLLRVEDVPVDFNNGFPFSINISSEAHVARLHLLTVPEVSEYEPYLIWHTRTSNFERIYLQRRHTKLFVN